MFSEAGLKRLLQQQKEALVQSQENQKKWEGFKDDYEKTKKKLQEVSKKVTVDHNISFGKLAFMPGKLVHTNEVMVLLGDNWFAQMSSCNACEVINRRVKGVDEILHQVKTQTKLLQSQLDYSQQLQEETITDVIDLQEDYDSDTEIKWRESHKQKMKAHKRSERQNQVQSDNDVLKRLEELELAEFRNREMRKLDEEIKLKTESETKQGNESETKLRCESETNHSDISSTAETSSKTVSFADAEIQHMSVNSSLDSDDSDSSSDNVIYFKHSPRDEIPIADPPLEAAAEINSPLDLYKFIKPKSILKSTNQITDTLKSTNHITHTDTAQLKPLPVAVHTHVQERITPDVNQTDEGTTHISYQTKEKITPVSSRVQERTNPTSIQAKESITPVPSESALTSATLNVQPKRPVSKFKQNRSRNK